MPQISSDLTSVHGRKLREQRPVSESRTCKSVPPAEMQLALRRVYATSSSHSDPGQRLMAKNLGAAQGSLVRDRCSGSRASKSTGQGKGSCCAAAPRGVCSAGSRPGSASRAAGAACKAGLAIARWHCALPRLWCRRRQLQREQHHKDLLKDAEAGVAWSGLQCSLAVCTGELQLVRPGRACVSS